MALTAFASPARGLSTLADATAAIRDLAQKMPSCTGEARTFTLNPPSISENSRLKAQRRLELEDKIDEEEEKEGEENQHANESLLKALCRMWIKATKQFDPQRNKNFKVGSNVQNST